MMKRLAEAAFVSLSLFLVSAAWAGPAAANGCGQKCLRGGYDQCVIGQGMGCCDDNNAQGTELEPSCFEGSCGGACA